MSNKYNNKHDASAEDRKQTAENSHGELRNGRLSMIKNNNSTGGERENEYLSELEESQED